MSHFSTIDTLDLIYLVNMISQSANSTDSYGRVKGQSIKNSSFRGDDFFLLTIVVTIRKRLSKPKIPSPIHPNMAMIHINDYGRSQEVNLQYICWFLGGGIFIYGHPPPHDPPTSILYGNYQCFMHIFFYQKNDILMFLFLLLTT